jgi:FkbM family methyltransferase
MPLATIARRFGNELYRFAFPIYRPLYSVFKSYADRAERELLTRILAEGSVVVDAGANIGVYSEFLSKCVGPGGVVHSFEPDPNNFMRLREALASAPNVRANQLAVSDRTGESVLYISAELNVDHRAYSSEGETRRTLPIRSITLDDYFQPGERVDLIKMDIQGYELHALRGADRLLAENPGAKLLLELWPYGLMQAGASAEALLTFLRDRNFSIFLPKTNCDELPDYSIMRSAKVTHYLNIFAQR